jgi:hypothetical protein
LVERERSAQEGTGIVNIKTVQKELQDGMEENHQRQLAFWDRNLVGIRIRQQYSENDGNDDRKLPWHQQVATLPVYALLWLENQPSHDITRHEKLCSRIPPHNPSPMI